MTILYDNLDRKHQTTMLIAMCVIGAFGLFAAGAIGQTANPALDRGADAAAAEGTDGTRASDAFTISDDEAARLESPHWEIREAQSRELLERARFREDLLRSILMNQRFHPEVHYRLLDMLERSIFTPRGAIGISFAAGSDPIIGDLHAGFPANDRDLLRVGDRIVSIAGVLVDRSSPVSILLEDYQPGDVVTITVLRPRAAMKDDELAAIDENAPDDELTPLPSDAVLLDVDVELGRMEELERRRNVQNVPQRRRNAGFVQRDPTNKLEVERHRTQRWELDVIRFTPRPHRFKIVGDVPDGLLMDASDSGRAAGSPRP